MKVFTVHTTRRNITVRAKSGAAALRLARQTLERGEVIISCFLAYSGGAI